MASVNADASIFFKRIFASRIFGQSTILCSAVLMALLSMSVGSAMACDKVSSAPSAAMSMPLKDVMASDRPVSASSFKSCTQRAFALSTVGDSSPTLS
eukprot:CAMPEP_0172761546 /NCGR_PEP_ID=MMETSP1074-20121228/171776_1 /TAXON_ID=2916 /ORGANISM="Ceratium fusus, Strain PA161109" /LENGTH=97 /DNA_ID=CAMNT_0013595777 /DNA_START=13 /DNA_END=302 /DNA_ORIENTATION=+